MKRKNFVLFHRKKFDWNNNFHLGTKKFIRFFSIRIRNISTIIYGSYFAGEKIGKMFVRWPI